MPGEVVIVLGDLDSGLDELHWQDGADGGLLVVTQAAPWLCADAKSDEVFAAHLGCLLQRWPELASGIGAAQRHGAVYREGDAWQPI